MADLTHVASLPIVEPQTPELSPTALRLLEARYLRRDATGRVVETLAAMARVQCTDGDTGFSFSRRSRSAIRACRL